MDNLKVVARVVDGVGKKSGQPYKAIEVVITDKVTKLVFLTTAEWELLKLVQNK